MKLETVFLGVIAAVVVIVAEQYRDLAAHCAGIVDTTQRLRENCD